MALGRSYRLAGGPVRKYKEKGSVRLMLYGLESMGLVDNRVGEAYTESLGVYYYYYI